MAMVLKIENLKKCFQGLTAVNDLNIEMKDRTIHSLIGPNGSGKALQLT
jgi:ABC-type branched-subunit amino acid transport system ATPase component